MFCFLYTTCWCQQTRLARYSQGWSSLSPRVLITGWLPFFTDPPFSHLPQNTYNKISKDGFSYSKTFSAPLTNTKEERKQYQPRYNIFSWQNTLYYNQPLLFTKPAIWPFLSAHLLSRCYTNLLSPQKVSRHVLSLFLMSNFLLSGKQWQARLHCQANIAWGRLTPAKPSGSSLPSCPIPLVSHRQETLQAGQTRNCLDFLACFKAKASLWGRLTAVYSWGGIKNKEDGLQINSHMFIFSNRLSMHTTSLWPHW